LDVQRRPRNWRFGQGPHHARDSENGVPKLIAEWKGSSFGDSTPVGAVFGYETVQVDGGKQLRVKDAEAELVRRIVEMSAGGSALKTIAKALNAQRIPSPRARNDRSASGWCPTGIRENALQRTLCVGRVVWNRSKFVKVPGTNRRVARQRPESEADLD
jgi:hypothetical protein